MPVGNLHTSRDYCGVAVSGWERERSGSAKNQGEEKREKRSRRHLENSTALGAEFSKINVET